jgi:hypothetical protein
MCARGRCAPPAARGFHELQAKRADRIRLHVACPHVPRLLRRRKRRRTATIGAALLALLAVAAGASALSEFSTGVPAVDDLLKVEGGSLVGEPGPGGATEPLAVPTHDGTAQALAYLSKDGTVCHVEAERHPRIEGSVRGGGGGCWLAADLARKLDRKGVVWSGSSHGPERRTYNGYADGDVEGIRVVGEAAGAEVLMTKPWTPRADGGQALRFFVVVDERDIGVGGDGVQLGELDRISTPIPPIEVTYADGRTEMIEAP